MNLSSINFKQLMLVILGIAVSFSLLAHGVDESTKQFLLANQGTAIIPFMYIGAKHMITGYDCLRNTILTRLVSAKR